MAKENKSETVSMLISLIVGVGVLTILIVVAAYVAPFKTALATTFGHHWLGKVAITYPVFFVVWLFTKYQFGAKDFGSLETWKWTTVVFLLGFMVIISAAMIHTHLSYLPWY